MSAIRANSDLLSGFPGCEEAATVLLLASTADNSFNHQTNVWFMRCGNVTVTVSLDEPLASADTDLGSKIIIGAADAAFQRVNALPLQHDAG
jgi:hypothetical protein